MFSKYSWDYIYLTEKIYLSLNIEHVFRNHKSVHDKNFAEYYWEGEKAAEIWECTYERKTRLNIR